MKDLPEASFAGVADYFSSRREPMVEHWARNVRETSSITASNRLSEPQLRDHVPQLINDFIEMLRGIPPDRRCHEHSCLHGEERWRNHYKLPDLLLELSSLREVIVGEYERYEEDHGQLNRAARKNVRSIIDQFIDDLVRLSTITFVDRQQNEIRRLGESRLDLLRTVSHELRNSVNAISMIIAVVRSTPESEKYAAGIMSLRAVVEQMREMLDQLMHLASLTSDRKTIEQQIFRPIDLISEAAAIHGAVCHARGLDFILKVDPRLSVVAGDVKKVRQIVNNLLSNAVKFTAVGKIVLSLDEIDENRWGISVTDTGRGISPEGQKRLFTEFYRVPGSEDIHGTGLGLAITKRLVELLGGEIQVESEAGEGSSFSVVLPNGAFPRS